ncbi:MAG: NADH-quinone oxidoreductase subunit NuoN [candidate division Zixibacteria bacterium]|nr:NADH-quinone oxidoreductase subunit NuoN [candidate division Zixibacteria bacterium]
MIEIPFINLAVIYPEIAIFTASVIVLLVDLFMKGEKQGTLSTITMLGFAAAAIIASRQWFHFETGFSDALIADNFALVFKLLFCAAGVLTLFLSVHYLNREKIFRGEYFFLILSSTVGMMILASANELITAFLGLEVMSVPLYLLAGYDKKKLLSNEAALKYFLMGAFASGILIYGIAFVYGNLGTTNFDEIYRALQGKTLYGEPLLLLGLGLILIGFSFKTAFVPFHSWVPDVYVGTPTPATAFFSIAPKAAGFAILFRLLFKAFAPMMPDITGILWVLAVLTMFAGNLIAIAQRNIKRMLAYSSIAHAGYILIALTTGTADGAKAAILYLLAYTAMNVGAFGIVILLGREGEKDLSIAGYSGLSRRHPIAAAAMALFMFSLAGIPPTAGFIGKFYIFRGAVSAGFIWLAILGVVNSLISVYYYLRVIVIMYMKPEAESDRVITYPLSLMVAIILAAWGTVQIGIFPNSWLNLVRDSVSGFF